MKRLSLTVTMLAGLCACFSFGPEVERFGPAHRPGGIGGTYSAGDEAFEAELLEVSDSALMVVTSEGRILLLPYATIRKAEFAQLASLQIVDGKRPGRSQLERLRIFSRYPAGLQPEIVRALLIAYGRTEVEVMSR
jgi:hypothetical protein